MRREPLAILYVGSREGTSAQRARTLSDLGHEVVHLASSIPPNASWRYQVQRIARRLHGRDGVRPYYDIDCANRAIRRTFRRRKFDVLWVDKALTIAPPTLAVARQRCPEVVILSFSLDDMMNLQNQTQRYLSCIPRYDLHVTNKSYNVDELSALGARRVLFIDNSFDPKTHRRLELSAEERGQFAAGIGFVGFWEQDRADMILRLCREGMEVTVHGLEWGPLRGAHPNLHIGKEFLDGLEYARAINATDINLGFLRKVNRDLQTTRSIEIPASGGFMLAERTDEHRRLFEEGREAEYFDSFAELLEKCRHYLAHPEERRRVAEAGYRRCQEGRYDYAGRLEQVLDEIARICAEGTGARRE
ncbi:MAG: glycosyltransferase [Myxococcota bacterium]|nr:glycosyltransferase [Myxococcota bacterium]